MTHQKCASILHRFAITLFLVAASGAFAGEDSGPPKNNTQAANLQPLALFSDAFRTVRIGYVDNVDDRGLIRNAISGVIAAAPVMQNHPASKKALHLLEADELNTDADFRVLAIFDDFLAAARLAAKENEDRLVAAAIDGMLKGLDPHSSYVTPKEFQDMQPQNRGTTGGVGVEIMKADSILKVIAPLDNAPADRAGVLTGDYITHIDGASLEGLTLDEMVEKMRGPVGSTVLLTIKRKGFPNPIQLKITRDIVRINPVKYSVEDDIGWIKIKTFQSPHTYEYLKLAVDDFKKTVGPKLKGYIVDLRSDPGGLLDQGIAVSNAFLDAGAIVTIKGRKTSETKRANPRLGDITGGKPLVVLINGGSAGASEIVAGALQDNKRASVVGTRSFGFGSLQTMIPLGANGGLRLTTSRYYTPSGRSIQATGIVPDYIVEAELPADLKAQMTAPQGEASLLGHLKNESSQEVAGSIAYVPKEKDQDVQFKAAIDLLQAIKISPPN